MGIREREQSLLWVAAAELPKSPGHPFYMRLNALLDAHDFDPFVEGLCRGFYAQVMGRPSLAPGRYFRLLLVGYFEGIDSERGIAWRATDSLAVRSFLRLGLEDAPPDHSTISRTRRLIDVETHRAIFTWVQQRLVEAGLLKGKTVAIDATTLEANAAMRSIVRRDTGESYQAFLTGLATASGIETPTREDLARVDKKRKKKTSNTEWTNPHDPDAKVTKMKDGPDASGPQSRACGRPGHRRHCRRHAAGRRPRRHDDDRRNGDGRGRASRRRAAGRRGATGTGRTGRRQGVSQQPDDGGPRRGRYPVVHRRAGPRPPRLVGGAGRAGAGLWQSPPDAWTTRTAPDAATR